MRKRTPTGHSIRDPAGKHELSVQTDTEQRKDREGVGRTLGRPGRHGLSEKVTSEPRFQEGARAPDPGPVRAGRLPAGGRGEPQGGEEPVTRPRRRPRGGTRQKPDLSAPCGPAKGPDFGPQSGGKPPKGLTEGGDGTQWARVKGRPAAACKVVGRRVGGGGGAKGGPLGHGAGGVA